MKRLTVFIASALLMTGLTACGGGETSVERAESALESAQNVIGEAADTKASQMADAALEGMEIPEGYGEIDIPEEIEY